MYATAKYFSKFSIDSVRSAYLLLFITLFVFVLFNFICDLSKGIDHTDESYYLLNASRPNEVLATVTLFGFYSKILFDIAGGDIYLFRIIGFSILMASAIYFSYSLNKYISSIVKTENFQSQFAWGLALTLSILTYYSPWLTTPSYNFFVLTGCLLVASSCITILNNRKSIDVDCLSGHFLLALILLSVGLFLCVIAKTPSALILGIILCIFLLNVLKIKTAISLVIAVVIIVIFFWSIHVLIFEESLVAMISKLKRGLELLLSLNTSHGINIYVTKLSYYLNEFFQFKYLILLSLAVTFFIWYNKSVNIQSRLTSLYQNRNFPVILFMVLVSVSSVLYTYEYFFSNDLAKGGLILVSVLVISEYIFRNSDSNKINIDSISLRKKMIFVGWLISFSVAFSIGSSSHPLLKMSNSWIFGTAALIYLIRVNRKLTSSVHMEYLCITMVFLIITLNYFNAKDYPYRLNTELSKQSIKTQVPLNGGYLYLDQNNSNYISEIKRVAVNGGWKDNTPLIDLTGETPFMSYFLNAKVVVTPWLFGPNSGGTEEFLLKTLTYAQVDDINRAWVLIEPNSENKYKVEILTRLMGYKVKNYKLVGGFHNGYTGKYQELLKPELDFF